MKRLFILHEDTRMQYEFETDWPETYGHYNSAEELLDSFDPLFFVMGEQFAGDGGAIGVTNDFNNECVFIHANFIDGEKGDFFTIGNFVSYLIQSFENVTIKVTFLQKRSW